MHTSNISTRPFMIVKTKNNSTIQKKKFNLFPIIVSLQKNWKTKKFLVRHKTKTITGMFQALFGWKTLEIV